MKKFICLLLLVALVFTFASCNKEDLSPVDEVTAFDGTYTVTVPTNFEILVDTEDEFTITNSSIYLTITSFTAEMYNNDFDVDFQYVLDYYGDDVIESDDTLEVSGNKSGAIKYSAVLEGEDGEDTDYSGYAYIIMNGEDQVQIDLYYAGVAEATDEDFAVLKAIMDTFKIN